MEVGVRELKTRLSAYLERVKAGETVIVTHRGKPVARLGPVETVELPAAVEALREAGRLRGGGRPVAFSATVRMTPGDSIVAKIMEERGRD
jgi:prevent-host-death family protein